MRQLKYTTLKGRSLVQYSDQDVRNLYYDATPAHLKTKAIMPDQMNAWANLQMRIR